MDLILLFALTVTNGVLAMSELAVVSARRVRLQQRADTGDRGASAAIDLADDPNRFLSTVQIGISFIGVLAGAFGGAALADDLANVFAQVDALEPVSSTLGYVGIVLLTTYLSLVVGELVPKRLAMRNPEAVASFVAAPMRLLSRVAYPVVLLLSASTELVLMLLNVRGQPDQSVTEDEINLMLREGAAAGVFERTEPEMVAGALRLDDLRADALMTPRTEIIYLDVNAPEAETRATLIEHNHLRYPVCDGTLDHVIGVARTADLLNQSLRGETLDLRAVMREVLFIPETTPAAQALDLLRGEYREKGVRIAMVMDEFSGVSGMLSVTDIVEAIVGEIGTPEAIRREDGSWLVDGLMPVEEFRATLDVRVALPGEDDELYQSMGGFVATQLGAVPHAGAYFEWGGLRFEVVDMDGRRVDKILVRRTRIAGKDDMP